MIYRLRNKETGLLATETEMDYLRINTKGQAERLVTWIGVSWKAAPEWQVEFGVNIQRIGCDKEYKPVYEGDIIAYSTPCLLPGKGEHWGSTPESKMVLLFSHNYHCLIGIPLELWTTRDDVIERINKVKITSSEYIWSYDTLMYYCLNGVVIDPGLSSQTKGKDNDEHFTGESNE